MTDVRDLLAEVASEAGPYDVTDRAIRTVRRRRRLALAAPIAAAVLVIAGVAAALPLRQGEPRPSFSTAVGWLPTRLSPQDSAPALPTDHGVAPASLVYWVARGEGAEVLLTEDGRHYRLPGGAAKALSLSPNGRWLAFARGDRLVLRDVTGTAERDLGVRGVGMWVYDWSPDSRWVTVGWRDKEEDPTPGTAVIDLESGRHWTLAADPYGAANPCGLRNSGALLLCKEDEGSVRFQLWLVDGMTGRELSRATVNPLTVLTDRERKADWAANDLGYDGTLLTDGRTLLVRASDYHPDQGVALPGDLLAVDVDDPTAPVRRYALPDTPMPRQERNPDGSITYVWRIGLQPMAAADEGLLLAYEESDPDLTRTIQLLDPSTERLTIVTQVDGPIEKVLLRG